MLLFGFSVMVAAVLYIQRRRRQNMAHLPVLVSGSSMNVNSVDQLSTEQELSTLQTVEQLYGQVGPSDSTAAVTQSVSS